MVKIGNLWVACGSHNSIPVSHDQSMQGWSEGCREGQTQGEMKGGEGRGGKGGQSKGGEVSGGDGWGGEGGGRTGNERVGVPIGSGGEGRGGDVRCVAYIV